ncbi:hypothetical protein [Pseudonocardia humida]|uniref:Uncharacterized protein n=1 Tax=Pseudonocardia humida TaxID=2800819 RepID=A0ABT1A5U9_9PSEU|nr:hypothetical protein [Pseudonocardia humida]MCO1658393.1 hypothetical protein [Pseudonocardia humida]
MTTSGTATDGSVRLAREVLDEAWRRYRGHLLPIVGLSLVGSAQRALVQFVGDDLPPWGAPALEGVTWGCRALLVVLLWRWIIGSDARLRGVGLPEGVRRVGRYAHRHRRALVLQLVGFLVAVLVLDAVPDLVIAPLVPAEAGPLYRAVLLAVKNPTVIAFTMVWGLALLHQALVRGTRGEASGGPRVLSERPSAE